MVTRVDRDAEVNRMAGLLRDFLALVSDSGCRRRVEQPSSASVDRSADWLERAGPAAA